MSAVDAMVDEDDGQEIELTRNGELDPDRLARFVRRTTRMGLTGEDAAKLAAYRFVLNFTIACTR